MSLLFRVRARLCALPLAHVVEIMRPLPVEAIAEAPAGVLGVAVIRGEPVAVIDVAELLGNSAGAPAPEPFARLVTVRVRERTIALVVDRVVDVRSLPTESSRELPPLLRDADEDVVGALGTLDAELLFVLRAARLVPQGLEETEVSR
jgi:purine-binding chemotaxis protein CheW